MVLLIHEWVKEWMDVWKTILDHPEDPWLWEKISPRMCFTGWVLSQLGKVVNPWSHNHLSSQAFLAFLFWDPLHLYCLTLMPSRYLWILIELYFSGHNFFIYKIKNVEVNENLSGYIFTIFYFKSTHLYDDYTVIKYVFCPPLS